MRIHTNTRTHMHKTPCLVLRNWQKLIDELTAMVDSYEEKHGPVDDRSEFDGDIVVPPHLRNISISSLRSSRAHGGLFGSLSRSRTFVNFSGNARHTFHGSVPDLARHSFSFAGQNNKGNSNNNNNSIDRRVSSSAAVTKITLNPSTKLAIIADDAASSPTNADTAHTNGNVDGVTIRPKQSQAPMQSHSRKPHRYSEPNAKPIFMRTTNSNANATNNNTLKQIDESTPTDYRSLERPFRALTPIVQPLKAADRKAPAEAFHTEGYMTVIQTNVSQAKQMAPCTDAAPLATGTSTFQSPTASANDSGFAGDISLDSMKNFKLPRVSLGPVAKQQPSHQQQ